MGLLGSIVRYGKWSMQVKPWWTVFPNQLKLIPQRADMSVELVNGQKYQIRPNTRDLNEVLAVGLGWEYRGIPTDLGTPKVIFDLGGHIGVFTVWARSLFPSARLVTIEPNPDNFRLLKENVAANGLSDTTTCLPAAVTAKDKKVKLFLSTNNNAHSLMEGEGSVSSDYIEVDGRSLEGLVKEYAPDFDYAIKMDIEGAEYEVLAASREFIQPAKFIVMEWHFDDTNRNQKWKWLIDYFTELGFAPVELSDRTAIWTKMVM